MADGRRRAPQSTELADDADIQASRSYPEHRYILVSPLFQGRKEKFRESCYKNLAPFWAVARCGRAQARRNTMCYENRVFEIHSPKPADGTKFPSEHKKWFVKVPVLRNIQRLAEGELLSLPFVDEEAV